MICALASRLVAFALACAALLAASPALARVERYAVIAGNNAGLRGEVEGMTFAITGPWENGPL